MMRCQKRLIIELPRHEYCTTTAGSQEGRFESRSRLSASTTDRFESLV